MDRSFQSFLVLLTYMHTRVALSLLFLDVRCSQSLKVFFVILKLNKGIRITFRKAHLFKERNYFEQHSDFGELWVNDVQLKKYIILPFTMSGKVIYKYELYIFWNVIKGGTFKILNLNRL